MREPREYSPAVAEALELTLRTGLRGRSDPGSGHVDPEIDQYVHSLRSLATSQCPPSAWNAVPDHAETVSHFVRNRCPRSLGIGVPHRMEYAACRAKEAFCGLATLQAWYVGRRNSATARMSIHRGIWVRGLRKSGRDRRRVGIQAAKWNDGWRTKPRAGLEPLDNNVFNLAWSDGVVPVAIELVSVEPDVVELGVADNRCSILFHLLVPGGKWHTRMLSPVSLANRLSSSFHSRTREPLLPPPSAVIVSSRAFG